MFRRTNRHHLFRTCDRRGDVLSQKLFSESQLCDGPCAYRCNGRRNSLLPFRLRFWRSAHRPGKIVGNPRCFCLQCRYRRALSLMVLSEHPGDTKVSIVFVSTQTMTAHTSSRGQFAASAERWIAETASYTKV